MASFFVFPADPGLMSFSHAAEVGPVLSFSPDVMQSLPAAIQPDWIAVKKNSALKFQKLLPVVLNGREAFPAGKVDASFAFKNSEGQKIRRYRLASGGYFEVHANGPHAGYLKEVSDRLERLRLKFLYVGESPKAVRIVFKDAASATEYYRVYDLVEGRLGDVVELGTVQNGGYVRERVYNRSAGTVTLFNPANIFEKRIFELLPGGILGRPLQFRERGRDGLVNLRFFYDDARGTVTCLHLPEMRYSVYQLRGRSSLGSLQELGTAKIGPRDTLQIITSTELSVLERNGRELPIYILKDHLAGQVVIRERMTEGSQVLGPMGRVLRYLGAEGDFEYIYDEEAGSDVVALTVLNYTTGEFLKFELPRKETRDTGGRWDRHKKVRREVVRGVFQYSSKYFMMTSTARFQMMLSMGEMRHFDAGAQVLRDFGQLHKRGPPSEGFAYRNSLLYNLLFKQLSFLTVVFQLLLPADNPFTRWHP